MFTKTHIAIVALLCLTSIGTPASAKKTFEFFQHQTSDYEPMNAYLTMLASRMTYWDSHQRVNNRSDFQLKARVYFITNGFPRVTFIENEVVGTQCVVLSNSDMALIAVRGSETTRGSYRFPGGLKMPKVDLEEAIKDWIASDANAKQISHQDFGGRTARVHSGFATAAEGVLDDLKSDLSKSSVGAGPGKRKPIFVTGHSLGGAVATLIAFRLKSEGFPVKAVYPHASPMVAGGPVLRTKFIGLKLPCHRVVNRGDVVTELPALATEFAKEKGGIATRKIATRIAPLPYEHITTTLHYIDSSGRVMPNPSSQYISRDRRQNGLFRLSFEYHGNHQYTLRLYNAISSAERVGLRAP